MAKYKAEHGFEIKHRSSDPPSPIEGEIWYNTTTKTLKVAPKLAAWASGPNINHIASQREAASPMSNANAAILAGGYGSPALPAGMTNTETWDGSSWTAAPSFGTGRRAFGSSSQTATASVAFGGNPVAIADTEEWNGSSWAEQNNLSTGRQYCAGFGSQTSAVATGGYTPSTHTGRNLVEEYDGTSWTAGGTFPASIYGAKGQGASGTAGFVIAGESNPNPAKSYDGTSWTDGGALNTVRGSMGLSGTSTDALAFGGSSPPPAQHNEVENYEGSSWTANPATLGTAISGVAGFGSSTSAIRAAGGNPSFVAATEEFSLAVRTKTVDTS